MKDWIMKLCPEISEGQAEVIAVQVQIRVAYEREACAYECEVRDGTFALKNAGKFFADIIRARGEV